MARAKPKTIPSQQQDKGSETLGRGPMTKYILRGVNSDGDEFFYTGKAGDGWVSEDRSKAFGYWTEEIARRRAITFNEFCQVHGFWFVAVKQ
jgi:hypothetical protein